MFLDKDVEQIYKKGITIDQVRGQITRLKDGMTHSELVGAATIGKGIENYNEAETEKLIQFYDINKTELSMLKFVPASGAATRMFKFLFQFLKNYNPTKETIEAYVDKQTNVLVDTFISNFKLFPFYEEVLKLTHERHSGFDNLSRGERCVEFVKTMVDEDALNYASLPKGLLPFHQYDGVNVTAFQEHLFESTLYASSGGSSNLHFTVSEKHHDYFNNELKKIKQGLQEKTGTVFNVSFSYQKEETETVALTTKDKVYRNDDGSILFRPAGHGALLENLNDLDHDIIFIKNIDNIVVADQNVEVSRYKKLLAGVLLEAQGKVFEYLHKLDSGNLTDADCQLMLVFLRYRLNVPVNVDFETLSTSEKIDYLRLKLNRPIRVCGMVKNQGEPGGGPFWVKDKNDEVSLQIVEFAQIDFSKTAQQGIVYKATHFNPTDLVCGVKDYKGQKFNLKDYVDSEAAFITTKTQNGVEIKALELPGLWNGSMAFWNSIFVEVPLETFNPVKTVNDLLKPAHQVS
ncbi:DUF4301 family protein [Tamlana sp. 2_MG-2023]|uniref:DUF4301 family protein n=1 Tax=unclassified Tamlana TaxID=2614803 RepID=UPI0026E23473|nr:MULTISPECIES: DUF4301 family protein [unclassified Tamlana]MDO6760593.1 DUF4301 family protein [Tamlana sp. 2_MG-2023]MDO6790849.1 DUF4301 family protein [Tamlana sp. 1_MG-2023]